MNNRPGGSGRPYGSNAPPGHFYPPLAVANTPKRDKPSRIPPGDSAACQSRPTSKLSSSRRKAVSCRSSRSPNRSPNHNGAAELSSPSMAFTNSTTSPPRWQSPKQRQSQTPSFRLSFTVVTIQCFVNVDIVEVVGSNPIPPTRFKSKQDKGFHKPTRDPLFRFLASRVRAARGFRRVISRNRAMMESHRRDPTKGAKRAERTKMDSRPRVECPSIQFAEPIRFAKRWLDGALVRRGEHVLVHSGQPAATTRQLSSHSHSGISGTHL